MGAGWAAAVCCARCSTVAYIGLVGRLAAARTPSPRWRPRARAPLPLCSPALPLVFVSPEGGGSRQGATGELHFVQELVGPVHGTHPAIVRGLLRHRARMHATVHALTAHRPIFASHGPVRSMRIWTTECSPSSAARHRSSRLVDTGAPVVFELPEALLRACVVGPEAPINVNNNLV